MAASILALMTLPLCRNMADQAMAASSGGGAAPFAGITPEMAAAAASSNPTEQMQVRPSVATHAELPIGVAKRCRLSHACCQQIDIWARSIN